MKKFFLFPLMLLRLLVAVFSTASVRPLFPTFPDPLARGNVDADIYAATVTAVPPQKVQVDKLGGRVRYICATYTQGASAGTIGDVIRFCTLPKGARILESKLYFGTGTASATLAVGITGSASALLAATAITAAGSATMAAHLASGAGLLLTGDVEVIGTNATAAIAANQKIAAHIYYTFD